MLFTYIVLQKLTIAYITNNVVLQRETSHTIYNRKKTKPLLTIIKDKKATIVSGIY